MRFTKCPHPGQEPGPLDPESKALTMWPPRLIPVPFTLPGSIEHRAQVILYTLLMTDRYSQAVDAGLLFYMKSSHMLSVPGFLHEKRALIMKRNEVARYLTLNRGGATGTMPGWYNETFVIQ